MEKRKNNQPKQGKELPHKLMEEFPCIKHILNLLFLLVTNRLNQETGISTLIFHKLKLHLNK